MNNVFIVFGYGVPKNILKDEKYNFYLKIVFNKIYSTVLKNDISRPIIIFCGGNTDGFKPYKRTEADEMIKFFSKLIKDSPSLKSITKNWTLISENKSLSTLENLINSKKILSKSNIKKANIFIFCEQTRENRIKALARKIFDKNYNLQIEPIDFDVSANRYLPTEYLAKKENAELKHSLWALKSQENLKKHHKMFEEKFEYFRKAGPKTHADTIKKWWDQKLKELNSSKIQ
ncbi:MAG: ElyC/SanA/YdcF family protein [Candidatus Moraniibacteriota bacterium]